MRTFHKKNCHSDGNAAAMSKNTRQGSEPMAATPAPLECISQALAWASKSMIFVVKPRVGVKPLCAWCVDLMRHGRSARDTTAPMIFKSEFLQADGPRIAWRSYHFRSVIRLLAFW